MRPAAEADVPWGGLSQRCIGRYGGWAVGSVSRTWVVPRTSTRRLRFNVRLKRRFGSYLVTEYLDGPELAEQVSG